MSHLPVTIVECILQGTLYLGAFERGERDHGASANGSHVVERAEHDREAAGVADRAERSDRRLATKGVGVVGRDACERLDHVGVGVGVGSLAERPCGHLDDEAVGIVEPMGDGHRRMTGCQLDGTTRHDERRVVDRGGQLVGFEPAEPVERAQGEHAGRGIWRAERSPRGCLVTEMTGHCRGDAFIRQETTQLTGHRADHKPNAARRRTSVAHMVIFQRSDGTAGYHQCDELNQAVQYVETIRNNEGVEHARIFRMEEVSFDFKPYFRVEIGDGATVESAAPAAETSIADAPAADVPAAEAPGTDEFTTPEPADAYASDSALPAPPPMPDPLAPLVAPDDAVDDDAAVGARRGLFGR